MAKLESLENTYQVGENKCKADAFTTIYEKEVKEVSVLTLAGLSFLFRNVELPLILAALP